MKKTHYIGRAFFVVVTIVAMMSVYVREWSCAWEHAYKEEYLAKHHTHEHSLINTQTHADHHEATEAKQGPVSDDSGNHEKKHKDDGGSEDKSCCKDQIAGFFSSISNQFKSKQETTKDIVIAVQVVFNSSFIPQPFVQSYLLKWLDRAHPPCGVGIRIHIQSFQI